MPWGVGKWPTPNRRHFSTHDTITFAGGGAAGGVARGAWERSLALGKPYETELDRLPETYRWAMELPVGRLRAAIRAASSLPLIAVGSGGSFTTADFAATLHRQLAGALAVAQTPMEAVATGVDLGSTAVFLATAGGKNPDVLGSFEKLALREPRRLVVLCLSARTPLARLAAKFPFADFIDLCVHFDLPLGYGLYKERPLDELCRWVDQPFTAPRRQELLV
jgi:hypothetical protein